MPPDVAQQVFGLVSLLYLVASVVVHVALAVGVWRDVQGRETAGRPVWFVNGVLWTLATLLTGVVGAGVYWVVHHLKEPGKIGGVAAAEKPAAESGEEPPTVER